jgi:heme/copper-type cytochrome/quinol oxidase subunit 3
MNERVVLELGHLRVHELKSASQSYWGDLAYMLIEGSAMAVTVAVYLYLKSIAPQWPLGAEAPDLGPGTWMTAILVLSLGPNWFVMKWADRCDLAKVRWGVVMMAVIGVVPLVLRVYEFRALNISWDTNAYGSVVWLLLGIHTTHLVTDVVETIVLAALMFTRHADNRRRYGDLQDNAMYWAFVVLTWLPIYGCLYWLART